MNRAPLVSVVIAAYNCEKLLPATLRSVQEQTLQSWECVIVDDGSTDGTLELARQWADADSRFRALSKKHEGPCETRNWGYTETNPASPYVTFMDCDDVWLPDALSTLVHAAEAAPTMAGAHGLADYIDESGAIVEPGHFSAHCRKRVGIGEDGKLREWDISKPTSFRTLLCKNTVFPPGVVLTRRACYERTGLFDPALARIEDWDMLVRLSRHGSFSFVDHVVLLYRRHVGSLSMQSQEVNISRIRHLQHKTYVSVENTPEQRAIVKTAWKDLQLKIMREKWKTACERFAAGKYADACATLVRIYVEIHRFLRGYPTARGL